MINTKELTIGCHVKVNGEPCKVDEVVSWSVNAMVVWLENNKES